jgi:hypothetical protein
MLLVSFVLGCGSSEHGSADGAAESAAGATGSAAGATGASGAGAAASTAGASGASGAAGGVSDGAIREAGAAGGGDTEDDAGSTQPGSVDASGETFDASSVGAYLPCTYSARWGSVTAAKAPINGRPVTSLGARFGAGNKVPDFSGCMVETFGACTAYTCGSTPLAIPPPPPVSAGAIEALSGVNSIVIAPATDGTYASQTIAGPLWGAGDLVTFVVAGDVAPAFTRGVLAPGPLTITAPPTPASGALGTIDRTEDLPLVWTNGSGALLELQIRASPLFSATSYDLRCRWPSADGAGVVPSAALAWIPKETTFIVLSSSLISDESVTIGEWWVELETVQDNQAPGGASFGGRYDLP